MKRRILLVAALLVLAACVNVQITGVKNDSIGAHAGLQVGDQNPSISFRERTDVCGVIAHVEYYRGPDRIQRDIFLRCE